MGTLTVICNCGNVMSLTVYEPDQDAEGRVGFDCLHCGSSLYGTYKNAENNPDPEEEDGVVEFSIGDME